MDKVYHFLANFVMGLTAFLSVPFAIGLCLGASFGKEYGDSKAPGNKWDWLDILADALGAAAGIGVALLIKGVAHA